MKRMNGRRIHGIDCGKKKGMRLGAAVLLTVFLAGIPASAFAAGQGNGNRISTSGKERAESAVEASSTFRNYTAENVLDGDPATAWIEGADGTGVGESLTFLVDAEKIYGIEILPGYAKNPRVYKENAIPIELTVESGEEKQTIYIGGYSPDFHALSPVQVYLDRPMTVEDHTVKVTITSALKGRKSEHTGISELHFLLSDDPGAKDPVRSGAAKTAGKQAVLNEGAKTAGKPVVLNDAERYKLNVFLSNFAEQAFGYEYELDAENPNAGSFARFAFYHRLINYVGEETCYVDGNGERLAGYTLDEINETIRKYAGIQVKGEDVEATLSDYRVSYYNGMVGALAVGGDIFPSFAAVDTVTQDPYNQNRYDVKFRVFRSDGYEYMASGKVDSRYYYLTGEEAAALPQAQYLTDGTACVRMDTDGRYRLVRIHMDKSEHFYDQNEENETVELNLSEDELYRINIFISNFAEQFWQQEYTLDRRSSAPADMITFALLHRNINGGRGKKEFQLNGMMYQGYTIEDLESTVSKYLGIQLGAAAYQNAQLKDWQYYDGMIVSPAAMGESHLNFAVVRAIGLQPGDIKQYIVEFSVFESNLDEYMANGGSVAAKYYRMDINQAESSSLTRCIGHGHARVLEEGGQYKLEKIFIRRAWGVD